MAAQWDKLMSQTDKIGTKLTYDGCHPGEGGLVAFAAVIAEALDIKRDAITFASCGKFNKLTEKQFNSIVDLVYK